MTLVVIRHLPTSWNVEDRLQGRADIDALPPDGREQRLISENRSLLERSGPFDAVFCSTLKRTRQTAEFYGYNPTPDPLLDEFDFGPFEGARRSEFMALHGKAWLDRPQTLVFGEAICDLEARVREFVRKCRAYERVLGFGHGCWSRALKAIHQTGGVETMNHTLIRNNEAVLLEF